MQHQLRGIAHNGVDEGKSPPGANRHDRCLGPQACRARVGAPRQHDPLTDLPNRALLSDRLVAALCPTTLTTIDVPAPNALLLLDLNNFKRVNERSGMRSGDQLLVELANRLRRIADPHDTVARLGGDEFCGVDAAAPTRPKRWSSPIAAPSCLRHRGRTASVTINPRASIGIAISQRFRRRATRVRS